MDVLLLQAIIQQYNNAPTNPVINRAINNLGSYPFSLANEKKLQYVKIIIKIKYLFMKDLIILA